MRDNGVVSHVRTVIMTCITVLLISISIAVDPHEDGSNAERSQILTYICPLFGMQALGYAQFGATQYVFYRNAVDKVRQGYLIALSTFMLLLYVWNFGRRKFYLNVSTWGIDLALLFTVIVTGVMALVGARVDNISTTWIQILTWPFVLLVISGAAFDHLRRKFVHANRLAAGDKARLNRRNPRVLIWVTLWAIRFGLALYPPVRFTMDWEDNDGSVGIAGDVVNAVWLLLSYNMMLHPKNILKIQKAPTPQGAYARLGPSGSVSYVG